MLTHIEDWDREESKAAIDMAVRARKQLLLRDPFLSIGSMNLGIRIASVDECQRLQIVDGACDARSIMINPQGFCKITDELRVATIAHETLHCMLKHIFRMADKQRDVWNYACDIVVNGMLRKAGFQVGTPEYCQDHGLGKEFHWILDPVHEGKSAEEIYRILLEKQKDKCINPRNLMAEPSDKESKWQEVSIMAAAAVRMACGTSTYGMDELIERAIKPKMKWRQRIPDFLGRYVRSGWSWCPPDNRFIYKRCCLPAPGRIRMGRIIVVVDTSGSMGQDQIAEALGVISSIIAVTRHQVDLLCCDVEATLCGQFTNTRKLPKTVEIKGRGGTDFRGAFEWVTKHSGTGRELEMEPSAMVYFTDGDGTYPATAPAYPVMWVLTKRDETNGSIPPFGQIAYMED